MERISENKRYIFITILLTLVPLFVGVLLWTRLPDNIATHFGDDNIPNGWSSKPFAVFGITAICLVAHVFTIFSPCWDTREEGLSNRVYRIILLICPASSLFSGVTIYGYALGLDINIAFLGELFTGIVIALCGNYFPKCRQNYTFGITVPWTVNDEDNWNHTHRFAGWIWILAGLFLTINTFINIGGTGTLFIVIAVMVFVPIGYSFIYYLMHSKH